MTVSSTVVRSLYLGTGAQTTFPIGFGFAASTDVIVLKDGVPQTPVTHFNIVATDVVFVSAPANNAKITIYRSTPRTQGADYITADNFPATTHEGALDKLTFLIQEIQDGNVLRGLVFPITEPLASSGVLPEAAARANKLLGFDVNGQPIAVADFLTASAFSITLLDNTTAAQWLTDLGLSSFFQTLVDDANAGAVFTTLGISTFIQTLLDDTTAVAARATLAIPYDLELDFGTPTNSAIAYRGVVGRAHTWLSSGGGHVSKAGTASAAAAPNQVFSVKKNGSEVLTITYVAEATTGTIAFTAGDVSWAVDDVRLVVAPAGIETTTLADIAATFLSVA